MMGIQCPTCQHYQGDLKCKAFPERIPEEILTGRFDHRKEHEGDEGIRYEKYDAGKMHESSV